MSLKNQVKINAFSDVQKLKESVTIKSPTGRILKTINHGKGKRHQVWMYTKETREPEVVTILGKYIV